MCSREFPFPRTATTLSSKRRRRRVPEFVIAGRSLPSPRFRELALVLAAEATVAHVKVVV
jgi:hypothetical protein